MRWLPDHVPNYLWAGGFLVDDPDKGLFALARILDAVRSHEAKTGPLLPDGQVFDGGLVALELVPPNRRAGLIAHLRGGGLADLAAPIGFVHAMNIYRDAPGAWFAELSGLAGGQVDPEIAERYLAPIVLALADGRGPAATAIKANHFRQMLWAEKLQFAPGVFPREELARYPTGLSPDERNMLESHIRALFGALIGADSSSAIERETWAKSFWRANWSLYKCREPQADSGAPDAEKEGPEFADSGERLAETWVEFWQFATSSDPDLYDPTRHEVLTGLAAHGLRITLAVAVHPEVWIGEFSAPLLRVVIEILITLAWLRAIEDSEPDIYARFKEFGRGHLKLMKLHAEDVSDRVPGGSEQLDELIEQIDREVNREVLEEFQDISLETTFSGRDLRKMALGSGTETLYRLGLAPMSAITHSEWPALEKYAMEICLNPLHRLHRLPRSSLAPALRPTAQDTATKLASQILEAYRAMFPSPSG